MGKRKRNQSPKERKLIIAAFPFVVVMLIVAILAAVGLGLIPILIIDAICLTGALILFGLSIKEHKRFIAEGNPEYIELDDNGKPINGPQPVNNEQPQVQPQGEQPQAQQPQSQPQSSPQRETLDISVLGKLLPGLGFSFLALAFLLRFIMFIRELVDSIDATKSFTINEIPIIARIIGPAILLAITIVLMIKFFAKKQSINQAYKSFLTIAILYAIFGVNGFVYLATSLFNLIYVSIKFQVNPFEVTSGGIAELVIYIIFDVALIAFANIAGKNKVNNVGHKIFAMIPYAIVALECLVFMICTSIDLPGRAPGYYVTAIIIMIAAGAVGAIPFLVKFEDKPINETIPIVAPASAPASQPEYQEPSYQEPQYQAPQPQNNNEGDPERKSNKKALVIILIVVGALVLCGGGIAGGIILSNNMKNKGNTDDAPSSQRISSTSAPKSSSTPKTSSSSRPSSAPSSSKPVSSSNIVSKTPKEVMIDICNNVFANGARYKDDYPSDYNYEYISSDYSGFYSFPVLNDYYTPVSSSLRNAVELIASTLPTYLISQGDPVYDTWEEGMGGYFQNFLSQDNQVKVELGSYIYSDDSAQNYLICQIYVHFNY